MSCKNKSSRGYDKMQSRTSRNVERVTSQRHSGVLGNDTTTVVREVSVWSSLCKHDVRRCKSTEYMTQLRRHNLKSEVITRGVNVTLHIQNTKVNTSG